MTSSSYHHPKPVSHDITTVNALHPFTNVDGVLYAVVEMGPGGSLWISDAATARQLLAAAYKALAILDPDGAPDTLIDLVEGDVLAKIRERIAAEDAVMKAVYRDASPPPGLACRDCHTTICPLNADGVCWNRASCAARVATLLNGGA